MTLKEWIETGYKLFGPKVMKSFDRFISGEIDFKACVDEAYVAYCNDYDKKRNEEEQI